jgi:hypothetical protein
MNYHGRRAAMRRFGAHLEFWEVRVVFELGILIDGILNLSDDRPKR